MSHFYHTKNKILVSANSKVMTSSLGTSSKSQNGVFITIIYINSFLEKGISLLEHYCLVRDPYRRVISFYKDKFINLPSYQKLNSNLEWQDVQRDIFTYLGIDEQTDSRCVILEKLHNISFTFFVYNILPYIYNKDIHVIPQHWILFYNFFENNTYYVNLDKRIFTDDVKFIKIEDTKEMKKFAKKIDFDLSIKNNSTAEIEDPKLTPDSIKIINDLYTDDFKFFDYPKL